MIKKYKGEYEPLDFQPSDIESLQQLINKYK
jgi:hypothetical protein